MLARELRKTQRDIRNSREIWPNEIILERRGHFEFTGALIYETQFPTEYYKQRTCVLRTLKYLCICG